MDFFMNFGQYLIILASFFYIKYIKYSSYSKNGSSYQLNIFNNSFSFDFSTLFIGSMPLLVFSGYLGSHSMSLIIFLWVFREHLNVQAAILFYFLLVKFVFFTGNILTILIFLEIQFYYSLYVLILSFNNRILSHNQVRLSTTLSPLVLINFVSSWSMFIFTILFSLCFSSVSINLLVFCPQYLQLAFLFVLFFKLGLGPWFFNSFTIYKHTSNFILVFFISSYFVFILPVMITLLSYSQLSLILPIFLLTTVLFNSKEVFRVSEFKEFLLYSSLLTFCFMLFLFFCVL